MVDSDFHDDGSSDFVPDVAPVRFDHCELIMPCVTPFFIC